MGRGEGQRVIGVVILLSKLANLATGIDCPTVTAFISACSNFVTYGSPDPYPESPCCVAITGLGALSDAYDDSRDVCRCLMEVITTYNPNATAIATLPGFCGVSLGFSIDPNTDCEYIP